MWKNGFSCALAYVCACVDRELVGIGLPDNEYVHYCSECGLHCFLHCAQREALGLRLLELALQSDSDLDDGRISFLI